MEEDEDVVFENSALYQHLKDVGYTEEEVQPEPMKQNNSSGRPRKESDADVDYKQPAWKKFLHSFTLEGMKKWYTDAINAQNDRYSSYVVDMIVESPGLVEDDLSFLQHFIDTEHAETHDPRQTAPDWSFFTAANLFVAVVAYLAVRLFTPVENIGVWIRALDLIVGVLLSIYIVPMFIVTFLLWKRRLFWCRFSSLLERYLTRSGEMLLCIKKSVLFIQEMEVISRGFTLVSARSPVSRLEQADASATQRQCPQLRQLLFGLARETMLLHRDATTQLYNKYPLQPEVDNVNNYIANISLEEYGPCLTISIDEEDAEERLREASDNYSVAALKAICRLCRLQCSEHIRRLAMMHIPTIRLPQTDCIDEHLEKGLSRLYEVMRIGAKSARRAYDFHRFSSSSTQTRAQTPESESESESKRKSCADQKQRKNVYTAVHSLELHLLSCLKRVRTLSEHVESRCHDNASLGAYNELMSEFNIIQHELNACASCWEEGALCMDRLYGLHKPEVPKMAEVRAQEPTTGASPINLFEMGDPVVDDQVFEAYSESNEESSHGDYSWDEFLTPEEKAAKKREKAEAKRLLLELKSVIDVKARERVQREKVAVQRMAGNTVQDDDLILPDHNTVQTDGQDGDPISLGKNSVRTDSLEPNSSNNSGNCEETRMKSTGRKSSDTLDDEVGCHGNEVLSNEDGCYSDQDDTGPSDRIRLEAKLERTCGVDFKFTSNLANLVAARSQALNLAPQETFNDEGEMSESQSDEEQDNDNVKES